MTTTPEGRVAAALRQAVIEAGGEIRKLKWEGRNGAPDYFILFHGRIFLIECKAPGQRPRASQMLEFERLLAQDIMVLVLDKAEEAKTLINLLFTGTLPTADVWDVKASRYYSIKDYFFINYRKK